MDRLTFNLRLNSLITAFLEDGGDPAYCANILRQIADEVFEEPESPKQHESEEHIALMRAVGILTEPDT